MNSTPPLPAKPARLDAAACRDVTQAAIALGVPRDYGRQHRLRRTHDARELSFIGHDTQNRPQWLSPRAARAWLRMRDSANEAGIELQIVSAFRSVEYQLGILRRKLDRGQSIAEILRVSAAPGYSEHHTGRALDISTPGYAALEEEFEHSPAFAWLSTNAQLHGFHLSYPRANPHSIAYEPWHWCWHR
ncbi:MAG TPA: M15 family metallopeptidase [Rudaea sp.]|nr:M15 family metallopeptidase [Rudaea sp.]